MIHLCRLYLHSIDSSALNDNDARAFQRWWLNLSQESITEEDFLKDCRVICYASDEE